MKKLEEDHDKALKKKDTLDFLDNDDEFRVNYAKLKAGINGEEMLAEYFEKIIKHDLELQDVILFASLSDPEQDNGDGEYISDSDFIAVYGNHILILDSKNILTNPEIPIYLQGNDLCTVGGNAILELHPSTHIWQRVFQNYNVPYESIHGCVVIVNKRGACIWKNKDWHQSEVKPLHVSELVNFLHEWIKDKEPTTNLSLLTALVKMQVKKEQSNLNLRDNMKRFGI